MNQLIFNAHACRLMNFNEAHHSIYIVSKKDKICSVLSRFENQYKYTQHNTRFYTVNKTIIMLKAFPKPFGKASNANY